MPAAFFGARRFIAAMSLLRDQFLGRKARCTMTKVILDQALRNKLGDLTQPLELCDESGRVLAQVTPLPDLSEYEPWEPPISEEELQRREQETESYSTAEVLAYLEKLQCTESDGNGPQ